MVQTELCTVSRLRAFPPRRGMHVDGTATSITETMTDLMQQPALGQLAGPAHIQRAARCSKGRKLLGLLANTDCVQDCWCSYCRRHVLLHLAARHPTWS